MTEGEWLQPVEVFWAPRRFQWVEGTDLMGALRPKPRTARRGRRWGELGISGLRPRQEELVLSRSGGQILGYGCQAYFIFNC